MARKKVNAIPPSELAALANKGGEFYDSDERHAKALNAPMLFRMVNLHIHKTEAELEAFLKNPNNYAIEKIVCRALLDAIKNGTLSTFEYFVSRLIGKTPDHVIVTDNNPYKDLSLPELIALRAQRLIANQERFAHIMRDNERMRALEARVVSESKDDSDDVGF